MAKVLAKGIFETVPVTASSGSDVDLHLSNKGYVIAVNADGSAIGGGIQYAEDAPHVSGDTGTLALGVRQDADTSPVSANGDYHAPIYDNAGNQKVIIKGGYTPGKLISAATTNATSVIAAATNVGYITASNVNAAARYLKIYNKASAPTVGSDTPVHTFLIPGNTAGAGTNIPLPPGGIVLGTGFAFALTTGATDADTGAVAANEIIINYGTR